MDAITADLADLLEMDATALSADGLTANDDLSERLARLRAELAELRRSRDDVRDFLDRLRAPLSLDADAGLALATGRVLALSEQASQHQHALEDARQTVATLSAERLASDRKGLIDRGLQSGQLTPFLVRSWAETVDLAVLSTFLETAPVLCPGGRQAPVVAPPAEPDEVLAKVARTCGMDPKSVRITK